MDGQSRVGAVILTYNKAGILERFFASLEAQTRRPAQVLVVDDHSTDGTADLLRRVFWRYPSLRLPKNAGQAAARNAGFRFMRTEYVIFLDADVLMEPRMLASMEDALDDHPEASIAYCHYDRVGTRTDPMRAVPWDAKRLLEINYVSMMSLVRRKDLPVPPLDESLKRYEDWDLWLRMMWEGKTGVFLDEVLFTAHYFKDDLSGQGESDEWRSLVEKKHGLEPLKK